MKKGRIDLGMASKNQGTHPLPLHQAQGRGARPVQRGKAQLVQSWVTSGKASHLTSLCLLSLTMKRRPIHDFVQHTFIEALPQPGTELGAATERSKSRAPYVRSESRAQSGHQMDTYLCPFNAGC